MSVRWPLCLILVLAAAVHAQEPIPFSIYAGGGIAFPLEPDTTFAAESNPGFNLMLGVSYNFVPLLQGIVKLEHARFGNDLPGEIEDHDWRITLIGAAVRVGMPVPGAGYRVFALAGAGVAVSERTEGLVGTILTYPSIDRETDLYFEIGGGLETDLGHDISLFLEGKYVCISRDPKSVSYLPVTLGLRLF